MWEGHVSTQLSVKMTKEELLRLPDERVAETPVTEAHQRRG